MPRWNALVQRMQGKPFRFVGVTSGLGSTVPIAEQLRTKGVRWRNGIDEKLALNQRWNIQGYPQLFLLDGHGVIRRRWYGPPADEELQQAIGALMSELAR